MHSKYVIRFMRQFKINRIVKILIVSDFLIWSTNQLFAPVFAIYVTDNIVNGGIEVVGFSAAIYLVTKSIFEIPVGMYIDKTETEHDDLYSAMIGTIMTGLTMFCFMYITQIWQLYLLQAILGIGAAIAFPGWYSIFTKHVDKHKEAFEWSLYDVLLGMGMAAAAGLGGVLVAMYGFDLVFVIAGVSAIIGALFLLMVRKVLR